MIISTMLTAISYAFLLKKAINWMQLKLFLYIDAQFSISLDVDIDFSELKYT